MWAPAAIEFLRELEANNNREWFKANRDRYDRDLLAPAQTLAEQLSHLGAPRFFRPYRDTRYRPGPPIKEEIAVSIGDGAAGVYYFQLSLDGLLVGAGLHHPESDQLARYRAAVDDEHRGAGLERAIEQAQSAGLEPIEPALKRAPKGYSPTHPRIGLLRMKHLTVFRRHPLKPWLHQPACDERVESELESTRAFVDWLSSEVGPSARPARSSRRV
jgi:uncharacterized protein (TIGR02453 family)